ncbi:AzlD domain-containing protein [Dongshaea marina]|uniref:AzlD domain-containing protein n=1 Tax=Dongshaea marina TaxID=2047966 RepID=UPI000D3EBBDA|nr:AzlD domain-containing protein [Dongshaea marina]
MSQSQIWIILLAGSLGTFAFRYSFLWLADRYQMPQTLRSLLKYVPAAVLAALVTPAVMTPAINSSNWHDPRLIAGIVALAIAWRTRNTLLTLIGGMLMMWLCLWLGF